MAEPQDASVGEGEHGLIPEDVPMDSSSLSTIDPASSTLLAEVEVVPSTGVVRVTRFVIGVDPGKVINPRHLKGNCEGGVVMGLGEVLMEQVTFDQFMHMIEITPNPVAKRILTLIARDETRHVAFGWRYIESRLSGYSRADLDALAAYLGGLDVHINLIPFNRVPEISALEASLPERCQEFSRGLKRRGFKVTTRYSLGGDIAAACGQLARVSELAGVS